MLNTKQINVIYTGLVEKYGEAEAYDRFLEKYPEYESELTLAAAGELKDIDPSLRKGFVDVDELMSLPEATGELDLDVRGLKDEDGFGNEDDEETTDVEPKPEVPAKTPKAEKPAKEPKAKTPKAEKPAKEPKAKKEPAGDSKAARAEKMYIESTDKSRKTMISMFIQVLGMSNAGASTYYQNIKKKVGA